MLVRHVVSRLILTVNTLEDLIREGEEHVQNYAELFTMDCVDATEPSRMYLSPRPSEDI
jgi:hypothetical protein